MLLFKWCLQVESVKPQLLQLNLCWLLGLCLFDGPATFQHPGLSEMSWQQWKELVQIGWFPGNYVQYITITLFFWWFYLDFIWFLPKSQVYNQAMCTQKDHHQLISCRISAEPGKYHTFWTSDWKHYGDVTLCLQHIITVQHKWRQSSDLSH